MRTPSAGAFRTRSILVVCLGNTCRSPMAAAVLRQVLGPGVTVESAGVAAGDARAAEHAVTVLRDRGIDLSGHRSRHVDAIDVHGFDLVIAMSKAIAGRLQERGVAPNRLLVWPVDDPVGGTLDDYREVLVAIDERVADEPRLGEFLCEAPR